MKKILFLVGIITISACNEIPKDYVTFSGTITNRNSDSIVIQNKEFSKIIRVNEDGSFSDTLKVAPGMYRLNDGTEGTSLFLRNGYDLILTLDTEMFDETISYTGTGAESNNFLAEKALLEEKLLDRDFDGLDQAALDQEFSDAKVQLLEFADSRKGVDSMVVNEYKEKLDPMLESYKRYYSSIIELRESLPKGAPSPVFNDYENFNGGTTSLADLKGKYVYVDVWATWCAPCKKEIPYLKEIETDYHGKNIAFVSMSIDDDRSHKGSWEQANADWRAMVAEKELGGIQIFAPEGWNSDFVTGYQIKGIPRFILIDPDGNIIDPSAPRPSDPKLRTILETLI